MIQVLTLQGTVWGVIIHPVVGLTCGVSKFNSI